MSPRGPEAVALPNHEDIVNTRLITVVDIAIDPDDYKDDGPLGWQALALCSQTDPEIFFPEKGGSTRDAKMICGRCAVRLECLNYALENDERFGIWGGLSERERRKLKWYKRVRS